MKLGVVSNASWLSACEATGVEFVPLPSPVMPRGNLYAADLGSRVAAGKRVYEMLRRESVDALLDIGGWGLTFVEGAGGLSDLKLTHEAVGVPLVSFFVDPIRTSFQGLPWEITWKILASPTWTKVVWDAGLAKELTAFGVGNVRHLAPAAPAFEGVKEPSRHAATNGEVLFIGDACAGRSVPLGMCDASFDWVSRIGVSVRSECADQAFFDIYHGLYQVAPAPGAADAPGSSATRCEAYFRTKELYAAQLSLHQRDRFVIWLKRQLGDRFRIVGNGWDRAYGLTSDPAPADPDSFVRMVRAASINLGLIEGDTESALNMRHFEIAGAGGFLLAYDHAELGHCFRVGEECESFHDEQSLLAKIERHVGNPDRRGAMARAGQQRVLSDHQYRHRLDALIDVGAFAPAHREESGAAVRADPPTGRPGQVGPAGDQSQCGRDRTLSLAGRSEGPGLADRVGPRNVGRESPDKLLVLLNPGTFTRNYLTDMVTAARRLGISTHTIEMGEVWTHLASGYRPDSRQLAALIERERVKAVIGCCANGLLDWDSSEDSEGRLVPFFASLGLTHLMWWTDHPQWAVERTALNPEVQVAFRSPACHTFVKSEVAALEIREVLGWPSVHALPVAEDVDRLAPVRDVTPDYDVVAIVGSPPALEPGLEKLVKSDDPDEEAIAEVITGIVKAKLSAIWSARAPERVRHHLAAFGEAWIAAQLDQPKVGSYRLMHRLREEYPAAVAWLRSDYAVYFDAAFAMWDFGRWQRTFILAYLSRYFRVGVFGSDWSSLGLGKSPRIEHEEQPSVYARGRVALTVSQAGDEEGISHKPFQIAASGVAMAHIDRAGLSDCFEPGVEVETFLTPREARDSVGALLEDPDRRSAMAAAARARVCRDHTWDVRLPQLLAAAGVEFSGVLSASSEPVEGVAPRVDRFSTASFPGPLVPSERSG